MGSGRGVSLTIGTAPLWPLGGCRSEVEGRKKGQETQASKCRCKEACHGIPFRSGAVAPTP
jgi:hypothetical protein